MPRHNRRVDETPRPMRQFNVRQLDHLAWFAHEHIDSHEQMLTEAGRDARLAMTLSEDPVTFTRFASVGRQLDERAKRLTGRDLSDAALKLVV